MHLLSRPPPCSSLHHCGISRCHYHQNIFPRSFKEAKERVLVTTNVCSRGIDVEQVTLVVNFDLPVDYSGRTDCETYLHRIGRTGRFGKSGVAINFIMNERDDVVLKEIEQHFGIDIKRLDTDNFQDMEEKIGDN